MRLKNSKCGDTFVEVCFALAIFSFLAVLAISSMNRNLSTVQSTLEYEVSRSEVDSQTEAIRYLHEAYVGGRNAGSNDALISAWEIITNYALTQEQAKTLSNSWPPNSCADVYNSPYKNNMMIVNTRKIDGKYGSDIVTTGNKSGIFKEATVVPRLVYNNQNENGLSTNTSNTDLTSAEGIWFYIVEGGNSDKDAFYDVYVQSCWNTVDNAKPRVTDTVFRLYDPEAIENMDYKGTVDYEITYNANGGKFVDTNQETYVLHWAGTGSGFQPPTEGLPEMKNGRLALEGWSTSAASQSKELSYSCSSNRCKITVYARWQQAYDVEFYSGVDGNNISGTVSNIPPEMGPQASPTFKPFDQAGTSTPVLASDNNYCYKFAGWSRSPGSTNPTFSPNNITLNTSDLGKTVKIYAAWERIPCGIYKVILKWGSEPRDLDSHTYVTANGRVNVDTYYASTFNDLSSSGNTIKVQLNNPPGDDTSGYGPEVTTITVNNLSDFTVLFRVHRYSGSGSISSSGTTVELIREDVDGNVLSDQTFKCPSSGYYDDWDVFRIVNRNISQAY